MFAPFLIFTAEQRIYTGDSQGAETNFIANHLNAQNIAANSGATLLSVIKWRKKCKRFWNGTPNCELLEELFNKYTGTGSQINSPVCRTKLSACQKQLLTQKMNMQFNQTNNRCIYANSSRNLFETNFDFIKQNLFY